VASALDGLTGSQREAVTHSAGTLLIDGLPGSGKTEVLVRRVCWLAEQGLEIDRPLTLARDERAAAVHSARIEELHGAPHEDLAVTSTRAFCRALIEAQSVAAGVEQLTPVLSAGERLALLLEAAGRLDLRHHDFRGRPSSLFAAFIRRIDALKAELIDAERCAEAAQGGSERDREFAAVYAAHEQILRERGVLDSGDLLIVCVRMLERDRALARGLAERHRHLLVDDWQTRSPGERRLTAVLGAAGAQLTLAGDDVEGSLRSADATVAALDGHTVRLAGSLRCPERVLTGALAIAGRGDAEAASIAGEGAVEFWDCASPRAEAQQIAAELERLLGHEGVDPEDCAVIVRSTHTDAPAIAEALLERVIEHRITGAGALFERTEVRDVLAWLRLLVDPRDAAAVVRALSRPPVELHAVDIARCVQIARRRKLDMVSALAAALESPQLAPEGRERIAEFLRIQRASQEALDEERADLFVHRLIERLGLRRHQLFSARADVVERLVNLARLAELAAAHARAVPGATPREFALYAHAVAETGIGDGEPGDARGAVTLAAAADIVGREFAHVFVAGGPAGRELYVAMTRARETLTIATTTPAMAPALEALHLEPKPRAEELFGPADALHALFGERRDELLESVARAGARLGELRFDTDLDVTHAIVRLLELIKLAALLERRDDQPLDDALADVNARLGVAASSLQREILQSSPLDALIAGVPAPRAVTAAHEEPSLAPFLPLRAGTLVLSASDIETYRACPLRYKFARVLRIPREPTLNQRFGIAVHQVLERYHEASEEILRLLDVAWRRGGLGDTGEERQLREKATAALLRYEERLREARGTPRWFERSFNFKLGRHLIRGRVDRIDELPGGGHELIDYKTGLPRTREQLREDVQLALYSLAARETWQIEATERTYYYVLDDVRVSADADPGWIAEAVERVGEGILAQAFEPTPSRAVCAMCDYRIACPAAER
jgi:DNA helicase-2/ATP-dependent DNA helicase PcrA